MTTLIVERGYVTASLAAVIEGVSRQAIHQRLKAGRINGAFLIDCGGGHERWCIPRTQLKPKKELHDKS